MANLDTPFVRHIAPKSLLSFHPANPGIDLLALNLIIGPNASGKSNLIEAIDLLRSTPGDIAGVIRRGGGPREWKGKAFDAAQTSVAWTVSLPESSAPIRHVVPFTLLSQSFALIDERIEEVHPGQSNGEVHQLFSRRPDGLFSLDSRRAGSRILPADALRFDSSVLAQLRDPGAYPELAILAHMYSAVRIYREWSFGRNTLFRQPQRADMRNDILEEDFSNIGLFLNRIRIHHPDARRAIIDGLKDLYAGFSDFDVAVEGGSVQVFFIESGFSIPATRLSDGAIRYLCLLAILCNPTPPPLICIEEPELGLHPDILPNLANLLRVAATRTQLIVTTHSDILVDAMTDTPESVIVCSKADGFTNLERLSADKLSTWLEKYRLGQLWTMGELGGTRW